MRNLTLYAVLVIASLLLSLVMNGFILTDDVYYYHFAERFSEERVEKIITSRKEWAWVGYAMIPVLCALKTFVIAAALYTGIFFSAIEESFASVFRITLKAEFIFLIPTATTLFWFGIVQPGYELSDVFGFPPVSLLNLFTSSELEGWMKYPLGAVNLFEGLYIFFLSYTLSQKFDISVLKSFGLVVKTYGTALLLWITFVVFMIVNIS